MLRRTTLMFAIGLAVQSLVCLSASAQPVYPQPAQKIVPIYQASPAYSVQPVAYAPQKPGVASQQNVHQPRPVPVAYRTPYATNQQPYAASQQQGYNGAPLPSHYYNGAYGPYGATNMERFYHYPYVTYPHNYFGSEYFRSNGSMYHKYPAEMRVPVYNKGWTNYYPGSRRYHWGHHFILDVF